MFYKKHIYNSILVLTLVDFLARHIAANSMRIMTTYIPSLTLPESFFVKPAIALLLPNVLGIAVGYAVMSKSHNPSIPWILLITHFQAHRIHIRSSNNHLSHLQVGSSDQFGQYYMA